MKINPSFYSFEMKRCLAPLRILFVSSLLFTFLTKAATASPIVISDGTFDVTANAALGIGFDQSISSLALQGDGKILVGGGFTRFKGVAVPSLVRLNVDGTVDTSFLTNLGTGFDAEVTAIVVQPDGKIVVTGSFDTLNGANARRIVRLNSNGTLDSAFMAAIGSSFDGGYACSCAPNPKVIALQSDGKILVGGDFDRFNGASTNALVRLQSSGALDTAFVSNSTLIFDYAASDIAVQVDGKILVAGAVGQQQIPTASSLVRLLPDGSFDSAFDSAIVGGQGIQGFGTSVLAVKTQTDGKILVGGNFTRPAGISSNLLARYSISGAIDAGFSASLGAGFSGIMGGYYYSLVTDIFVFPTGESLITGSFSNAGSIRSPHIARMSQNGGIDSGFVSKMGGAPNGMIRAAIQLADGRYVVAGEFTELGGHSVGRIAVLGHSPKAVVSTPTSTSKKSLPSTGFDTQQSILVYAFFCILAGICLVRRQVN